MKMRKENIFFLSFFDKRNISFIYFSFHFIYFFKKRLKRENLSPSLLIIFLQKNKLLIVSLSIIQ